MLSAEELHERGVRAINAGRVRQAAHLLERAAQRSRTAELSSRVDASLAYVAAETGDHARALELCDQALGREGLTDVTGGIVQSQRALLLMRRGDVTAALAAFDRAIGLLVDEPVDAGRAFLNRGGALLQQGDPEGATHDFARAAGHFTAAGLDIEAAKARHNLGYAHLLAGDLVAALRHMDAASPVLSPLSPVNRAIGEQDRAEVLMAAGLVSEGAAALEEAAHIYGHRRLHQRRGEAELALARSLMLDDPGRALAAARGARSRFVRTGSDAWRVRAEAVTVGAEIELGRRGPTLVDRADAAAAQLDAQGLSSAAAIARLHAARVQTRRRQYDDAARRLREVPLRAATPLNVRMLARTARVELDRARGRRTSAARQARVGLDDLQAWVSTFGSLDLQTSAIGRGRALARHGLELAVDSGRPDVVFEWSERARMFVSRMRPVRPPADPGLADDLSELRQLHLEDEPRGRDPRRSELLQRRVRERALHISGSGELTDPVTLTTLQEAVGQDTALVAYLLAHDRLTALVVTDETAELRDLGPVPPLTAVLGGLAPDLDMAASDLPEPFASTVRRELTGRLEDVAAILAIPLLDAVGDRRLVLTPSGVLAGVPWGLLPGFNGRPVSVAQSATSWLTHQASPLRLGSAGFVAGPRVARAEPEVAAAAALWPGSSVLVGEAAATAAVSDLAARVDVLHVSAHGRHSAENPLFSGIELVDGPWFGYDIDQLAEVPDVVLLSACEVGRSQVRYGEELIGMTAAWQHAGVRSVIASAAAVNDDVAHDVLVAVHRGLAAGMDPPAALAAALPAAGEDAPPAPFVAFC